MKKILIELIALIAMLLIILTACTPSQNNGGNQPNNDIVNLKLGELAEVRAGLNLSFISYTTEPYTDYYGETFTLYKFSGTVKNTSAAMEYVNGMYIDTTGSDGKSYSFTFSGEYDLIGDLMPNTEREGQLSYKVPTSVTIVNIYYKEFLGKTFIWSVA